MRLRSHLVAAVVAASLLPTALVGTAAPTGATDIRLRPIPVAEGVRDTLEPSGDPKKLREEDLYKRALKLGVDLAEPQRDPVVAHTWRDGRLFYVFYKTVENAFLDRPYVIQRIKRTERNWATPDAPPEEKVTYQVEVFKLLGGAQKRADQHHGIYSIGDRHRREIVKEYEIGFGHVPEVCEGTEWPFDRGRLFEYLYRYGPEREVYDQVEFLHSKTWSLSVSLDEEGAYRVHSSELGLDVPAVTTDAAITIPPADEATKDLVLVRGVGLGGIADGELVPELAKLAGSVIDDVPAGRSNRNVSFAAKLIANVKADGSLNTLRTRRGFAGSTAEGIRIGDSRARVLEVYGTPTRQYTDAAWWHFGDIGFWFDGLGRVARMYVRAR